MDKQTAYCNPEIWGGIECTINRVNNTYFDQLTYSGHYNRETDIAAIAALNIRKIRYPVLWEKHQPEANTQIDWTWTERQLSLIRDAGIEVIAGLVHHGSGPSFTQLNDRNFPELLAEYAGKVAEKFPWIEYYTPVNEPSTTARFSGLYGLWYPHHRNTRSFFQMLLNELKGVVLSMQAIRKINPRAKLVQTEDLGKTYATPLLQYQARFENERRWLTYDILCGKFDKTHKLWKYFSQFKIPVEDLQFFLDNPCVPDVFGFNHYLTSERYLDENLQAYPEHTHGGNSRHRYVDVEAVRVDVNEQTGIEALLKEAWERYHQPMAVTEVHLHCHREEQLRWFKEVWEATKKLRSENIPIVGVTSWALLGSYGWNRLLTEPGGEYEPGAFDLRGGTVRPTALARFVSELASDQHSNHLLSQEKGWWQRSTRLIYSSAQDSIQMRSNHARPILIIGKNGTLGKAFARTCQERFISYRLLSRQDCDISQLASIEQALELHKPWAIINAAGFVRVDDAANEWAACERDNVTGPHNLAVACNRYHIPLLTFSSDLVFDGKKDAPYIESDSVNPLNKYGLSKASAEALVKEVCPDALIVRTSAFFSPWDEYNFAHHVRKTLSQFEQLHVADDMFISPTYVPHLVNACLDLFIDGEKGTWHLANDGALSWADFATEIATRFSLDQRLIRRMPSSAIYFPEPRPNYSVLSSERGILLPTLEAAFRDYARAQQEEKRKVA